jgi:luciferase family oxidoreductase group 1
VLTWRTRTPTAQPEETPRARSRDAVLPGHLGGKTAKVTVLIEPPVDDVEARSDKGRAQRPVLVRPHFDEQPSAGTQETARGHDDPADHIEPVVATVEGTTGLIALDIRREKAQFSGRDVGRHGRDDVEAPGTQRRVDVGDEGQYPVTPCAHHGPGVDVDGDHRGRRRLGHQVHGDGARPGTEVCRPPSPGDEECGGSTSQFLTLESRNVDTGVDVDRVATEALDAGDPGQGLAAFASADPLLERGVVGSGREQLVGFLNGGDTARRRQTAAHDLGDMVAGRHGHSVADPDLWRTPAPDASTGRRRGQEGDRWPRASGLWGHCAGSSGGKGRSGFGVVPAMVPLSVLDLATVATGSNPARALAETTRLSVAVEQLGYNRLWVAEHHGMPAVASSAPAVLIAHLADATTTLRVGSGGVMLPNHSPLVVAEQFGTLEALHPGRIDLGLGRAPGTDHATARALRRARDLSVDTFPDDVVELISYLLANEGPPAHPSANPGNGYLPEVWLLGSSVFSAQLAGLLGLPFSFAYHFAPKLVDAAFDTYRSSFRPSILLREPRAMVAVSVLCAPDNAEARWLSGSSALSILQLRSGRLGLLPSPEEAEGYPFTPEEMSIVDEAMSTHVIGDPETVHEGLQQVQRRTDADEIMLSTRAHSYEARVRSLTLIADRWGLPALTTRT